MPDQPFTVADVHQEAHLWVKQVPDIGAMDDWRFRVQADDSSQHVIGWLTYVKDKKVVEQCEQIPYEMIAELANRFGSALAVLDQWFLAICDKAGVSQPLFPDRERRKFK